jgi:hypothetical protein
MSCLATCITSGSITGRHGQTYASETRTFGTEMYALYSIHWWENIEMNQNSCVEVR